MLSGGSCPLSNRWTGIISPVAPALEQIPLKQLKAETGPAPFLRGRKEGTSFLVFIFCVSTEWLSRQQCSLWAQAVKRVLWRNLKRAAIWATRAGCRPSLRSSGCHRNFFLKKIPVRFISLQTVLIFLSRRSLLGQCKWKPSWAIIMNTTKCL